MAYRKGYTPKRRRLRKPNFEGKYRDRKFSGPEIGDEVSLEELDGVYYSAGACSRENTDFEYLHYFSEIYESREDRYWNNYADSDDVFFFHLISAIQGQCFNEAWPTEPVDLAITASADQCPGEAVVGKSSEWEVEPDSLFLDGEIEACLHSYVVELNDLNYNDFSESNFARSIEDATPLKKLEELASDPFSEVLLIKLFLFEPFWIRRVEDWEGGDGISLIRHLLVAYDDVPLFLYHQWIGNSFYLRDMEKWTLWLIILGQGGSLRKAAAMFFWSIPKKLPHFFLQIPSNFGGMEACLLAEVLRFGGTAIEFERIYEQRFFQRDPTDHHGVDDADREFFQRTVEWLSLHRDEMTDEVCCQILRWGIHKFSELKRQDGDTRRWWGGRSVRATRERAEEYYRDINRPRKTATNIRWQKRGWDYRISDDENGDSWSFVELNSSEDLSYESNRMQHCVATYNWQCQQGSCAIFSLRKNRVRKITIEIEPISRRLVQARGFENRAAYGRELKAIQSWMTGVVLLDKE